MSCSERLQIPIQEQGADVDDILPVEYERTQKVTCMG